MQTPSVPGVEVVQRIGRGERGAVWSARRAGTQPVAVKVLPAVTREPFLQEAQRAMVPSHANLVQVFDAGITAGQGYLVMQWVDGVDLELVIGVLRMHARPIPPRTAAFIAVQLLRALAYLHRIDGGGTAHGNVRASHVLLSTSGEVKLCAHGCDLGGTPADDIREVGIILHALLTGELVRDPDPDPLPDVPSPLDAVRRRLLATDPTARPSAREALRALETWSAHRDATTEIATLVYDFTGLHHPRTITPPPRASPPLWPKAFAAALALGTAAALLLS